MSYKKPFPRVFLPSVNKSILEEVDYLLDARYVEKQESSSLVNAGRIIIKDYRELIDYIEPTDDNKAVYSHRIYELLLRTATEFEANCKGVLFANGYCSRNNLSIIDYYKLNALMQLDKYEIKTHLWNPEKKFYPLAEWANGHVLTWYKAYNSTKHNRYKNFGEATLENLFNGICSLIVLLAAQFPNLIGYLNMDGLSFTADDDRELLTTLFSIKYPQLADTETYEFDWNDLKSTHQPFGTYSF